MTYNEFHSLLKIQKAAKLCRGDSYVRILLTENGVYLATERLDSLRFFPSLPNALEQFEFGTQNLKTFVQQSVVQDWICDRSFRVNSVLSPEFLFSREARFDCECVRKAWNAMKSTPETLKEPLDAFFVQACLDTYLYSQFARNIGLNERIYHVLPFKYLLRWFKPGKGLRLQRPIKWTDPWENFLFKHLQGVSDFANKETCHSAERRFFAMSWSRCSECEGIWSNSGRSVSSHTAPGKNCFVCNLGNVRVQVETTVSSFLIAVMSLIRTINPDAFAIRPVEYASADELRDFKHRATILVKQAKLTSEVYPALMHSLFLKRDAFSYEREVRVVFCDKDNTYGSLDAVNISLSAPHSMINQITVDPRCDDATFHVIERILTEKYNFSYVKKSELLS